MSQGFCGDGEEEGHCAQEDHSKDGEDCAAGCISSREHWLHDGRSLLCLWLREGKEVEEEGGGTRLGGGYVGEER